MQSNTIPPLSMSHQSQGKRSTTGGSLTAAATYSNLTAAAAAAAASAQPHSSKGSKGLTRVSGGGGGYHQHYHHGGGGSDLMSPPGQGTPHHQKDGGPPAPSLSLGTAISDFETVDSTRNPLHCLICNNVFDDPRLLACYHSFCAKCLDGRLGDTKVICPLCGKVTPLKEGSGPAPDFLLRYLLHTTSDLQPSCANCDNKGRVAMYYCNTCGQVLCNGCREETHRAKMFSAHDIIPVSRHTKETPKKCSVHGEHFIMFSTVRKTMLCINCYRDEEMQARLHCVDLDTAYSQGCRKLDRAVMSLRDLQVAVRDGITMLKNVLEELRRNSDSEKSAVSAVCQTILDALTKTQENLLRDVDCQSEVKDKVIRGQLCQLRAVLPTIKLHLTMCASISNAASKYDFLDLAYPLIDRLTAITHMGYPIRPGQSSQIKSSYKTEIARTLEPWISGTHGGGVGTTAIPLSSTSSSQLPKDYTHPSINLTSVDPTTFTEPTYSQYYPMSRSTVTPHGPPPPIPPPKTPQRTETTYAAPSGRKTPTSSKNTKSTLDGVEEQFTAHCRSFSTFLNELNQRLARLKEQVQDLHRDVTLQRGASYIQRTEAALCEGLILEEQLNRRQAEMERIKKLLESSWNEHMRVVRIEQEVFQTQMNDLLSMKVEVKQLSTILQQLQSFLKTVESHQLQLQHQQHQGPGGSGPSGGGQGSSSLPRSQQGQGQGSQTQQSQQQGHHQQQQQRHENKGHHHLSSATETQGLLRMESSSQVTPSLTEMGFNVKGNAGVRGPRKKETSSSLSQKSSELVSRLGRFSISKVSGSGGPGVSGGTSGGSAFIPLPSTTTSQAHSVTSGHGHGHGSSSGSSIITPAGSKGTETEYIQVDTSFPPPPPHPLLPHHTHAHKRGILNQLIDKVRSKDDRKKSISSSLSGSASGAGIPSSTAAAMSIAAATSAVAASNRAAARAAMYDAQVQYGNYPNFLDKSAVTALRKAGSQRASVSARGGATRGGGSISGGSVVSSRTDYPVTRPGKPFVKSKSDDERPPTKLSRESRARSVAAMDPESLLRSLSSSSKEAARILSLYRSLLQDKDSHGAPLPPSFYQSYTPQGQGRQSMSMTPSTSAAPSGQGQGVKVSESGQRTPGASSMGRSRSSSRHRRTEPNYLSEDDYQQISFAGSHPTRGDPPPPPPRAPPQFHNGRRQSQGQGQGHSAQAPGSTTSTTSSSSYYPRMGGTGSLGKGGKTVQVFVHQEPGSAAQGPLSKSLEEQYLFGFISETEVGCGSSQGGSGLGGGSKGHQSRPLLKKPISVESLISLSSGGGGGTENSRKSSIDFDRRSVVTVRRAGSKSNDSNSCGGTSIHTIPRQHSWEAGLSSNRSSSNISPVVSPGGQRSLSQLKPPSSSSTPLLSPELGIDDDEFGRSSSSSGRRGGDRGGPFDDPEIPLHKADSFEGHEEAVRSLVAAVQETRTLQRKMQPN